MIEFFSKYLLILLGDAVDYMSWFLNSLHSALGGNKKLNSSIINKTFRGKMTVYSRMVPPLDLVRPTNISLLFYSLQYTVQNARILHLFACPQSNLRCYVKSASHRETIII